MPDWRRITSEKNTTGPSRRARNSHRGKRSGNDLPELFGGLDISRQCRQRLALIGCRGRHGFDAVFDLKLFVRSVEPWCCISDDCRSLFPTFAGSDEAARFLEDLSCSSSIRCPPEVLDLITITEDGEISFLRNLICS